MRSMLLLRLARLLPAAWLLACAGNPGTQPAEVSPAAPASHSPDAQRASGTPAGRAGSASASKRQYEARRKEAARRLGPLGAALRQKLSAIRADPPPRAITRNRHYLVSNENQHHLLHEIVAGRGGIHVGVGTEQDYLIAGWSRPEIMILMDYDQWVADLNWIYGLLFLHAETPDEFISLWSFGERKKVVGWIKERWPEHKDHWKKIRVFDRGHADVQYRLKQLRRRHAKKQIPAFVDDQQQYDYLVRLWRTGRVLPVRGDLLQQTTLRDIAAFSRAARIPVRVLYLSNAEDYFTYDRGNFKANMLALPYDKQSLVLHTKPYDGIYYRYVYQTGKNYQAWLESGRVNSWCDLMAYSEASGSRDEQKDLLRISVWPKDEPKPRPYRCSQPGE